MCKTLMKMADAEQAISNVVTHATPNPEKPVTRLRAGLRGGAHGVVTGGVLGAGLGAGASHIEDHNMKMNNGKLITPKHKQYAKLGGAVGAAAGGVRGVYRGMRGLGPVRGTRVKTKKE